MDITKEDYKQLKTILTYKTVNKKEVHQIEQFIQKHIDPKAKVCNHCSSQIRFAFNRIKNWYNKNKVELDESQNTPDNHLELTGETITTIQTINDDKHYCKCGKKELPSKRNKYCDECRPIKNK